jgi:predicted acyltransferase
VTSLLLGGLWALSFPINKRLWTSSFVLYAGGWSLLLLAFFIWAADMRRRKEGEPDLVRSPRYAMPLLVFGTNAIFAYVLSELLASTVGTIHVGPGLNLQHWCYQGILAVIPNPAFASLLYSLGFVAVCWLIVYVLLYRRRIFIKI